ncbi:MAG: radical SAM/CxCxxxxC motif protein YfkAB [Gorillibacterium sp.]|nr:radical SAM/CxCxxxxC motif protein YfkAB [Gorillibacterium sp.]
MPQPIFNQIKDPWDPIHSITSYGRHVLTSVEMTVTNLCNMRCEHCAVGDVLTTKEEARLPMLLILKRLDEVEHLETISLTGGEPSFSMDVLKETVLPLLKYAKNRGVKTQMNSNLTLELARYELIAPYVDVMHTTFNYTSVDDYHGVGFTRFGRDISRAVVSGMYERMMNNTVALTKGGLFVSAESLINFRTHEKLGAIHHLIAEMGCQRHEVNPMYTSAFATSLQELPLSDVTKSIHHLLDARHPNVQLLFGTLPFFACSDHPDDLNLLQRLSQDPNVSVRNDQDGKNRLNFDLFNGNVRVTDFSDVPPVGNIHNDRLDDVFGQWLDHSLSRSVSCHCPKASCTGPNLLVSKMYYSGIDFTKRIAKDLTTEAAYS